MESKEERLLRAIFGNEPQAKALKFSLNIQFQPRKSNSA